MLQDENDLRSRPVALCSDQGEELLGLSMVKASNEKALTDSKGVASDVSNRNIALVDPPTKGRNFMRNLLISKCRT